MKKTEKNLYHQATSDVFKLKPMGTMSMKLRKFNYKTMAMGAMTMPNTHRIEMTQAMKNYKRSEKEKGNV